MDEQMYFAEQSSPRQALSARAVAALLHLFAAAAATDWPYTTSASGALDRALVAHEAASVTAVGL